jgi:geranylgeranyl pyrophosphate synthase
MMPPSSSIDELLHSESIGKLLSASLLDPIDHFFKNPGKNLRSEIVHLGFGLSLPSEPLEISEADRIRLEKASMIVELIHGGSLIVDDIQDSSLERRNAPTLHLLHGIPLALNAGNWLYFWALSQLNKLKLEQKVTEDILSYMMKAHAGQALDIGTRVDLLKQDSVSELCLASMELKTGTVMSLALRLGAGIAGKDWDSSNLNLLGSKLGVLLQIFDDLGNFLGKSSKRYEDLYLRRPTWIWSIASGMSRKEYFDFVEAVQALPSEAKLNQWMKRTKFADRLIQETETYRDLCEVIWESEWKTSHPESFQKLISMNKKLEKAYV